MPLEFPFLYVLTHRNGFVNRELSQITKAEGPRWSGSRLMPCYGRYAPNACLLGPLWRWQPPVKLRHYQYRPDWLDL